MTWKDRGPCVYCDGTGTVPGEGWCKMCGGTGLTPPPLLPPLHPMCRCIVVPVSDYSIEDWMRMNAKAIGWDGQIVER